MDLRQLENFVAVAQAGSVTVAARQLHLAQSSVSESVQALERSLRVELFKRRLGGAGLVLTPAGHRLLTSAQAILGQVRIAREAVQEVPEGLQDRVTVACAVMPRHPAVRDATARLLAVNPAASIDFVFGSAPVCLDHLAHQRADVAICAAAEAPPGMRAVELSASPVVVLAPTGHHLTSRSEVEPDALVGERIVDLRQDWVLRRAFDEAFTGAGTARTSKMTVSHWHSALEIARSAGVLTYGPAAAVAPGTAMGLNAVRLVGAPLYRISLVTSTEVILSATARAFADTLVGAMAGAVTGSAGGQATAPGR